jgi:chromosome condensin MukBEF MukE localization factor
MSTRTQTPFNEAIYTRQKIYSFGPTEFNGQELKTLLLIDGRRTVKNVAKVLGMDDDKIRTVIGRMVKLGIIQTESENISFDIEDLVYETSPSPLVEHQMFRLSQAAV